MPGTTPMDSVRPEIVQLVHEALDARGDKGATDAELSDILWGASRRSIKRALYVLDRDSRVTRHGKRWYARTQPQPDVEGDVGERLRTEARR